MYLTGKRTFCDFNSLSSFESFRSGFFSATAEGFSATVLKDSVRGLRYKIGNFIWVLAHKEKYIDYIDSAARHFNTGVGFSWFLLKSQTQPSWK